MAQLKTDDAGHAIVQDGKPVYVVDGKDVAFDYTATLGTISRLNGEAKTHREAKEAALTQLKAYEGIEDAEKARAALATVAKLDSKALFDAGKVDELKAEMQRAYDDKLKHVEAQYKPHLTERDQLKQRLHNEIIGGNFARSKFIADKMAVPVPMVEATFGRHFALDGDKLTAKDAAGNLMYSRAIPGEIATFDEALEMLVDASPFRDNVLKGTGASGSGATGAGGKPGSRALPRAAFDALSPVDRMSHIKGGGTVTE